MGGQGQGGVPTNPYAAMQGRVPAAMQAFQQARQQQMNALYPQQMTKPPMGQPSPLPPMGAGGAMPSIGTTTGLPSQMAIRDMYTANPGLYAMGRGLLGGG